MVNKQENKVYNYLHFIKINDSFRYIIKFLLKNNTNQQQYPAGNYTNMLKFY